MERGSLFLPGGTSATDVLVTLVCNSGIIMIMIPSVKTSKMVVAELEGLEVRGWLLSEAPQCLGGKA